MSISTPIGQFQLLAMIQIYGNLPCMRMNFGKLIPAVFGLSLAGAAHAECTFCAKEVVFSKELAACYIAIAEKELTRAKSANLEFHAINLANCEPHNARNRAADPLPIPKRQGAKTVPETTLSFLIPPDAIPCLARLLAQEGFDPENIKRFPVKADCGD